MTEWYLCSGSGPHFVQLDEEHVLEMTPERAAREYAQDACKRGLGDGRIDVVVTGTDMIRFEAPLTYRFSVRAVKVVELTPVSEGQ